MADDTECIICLEEYKDPKILPCSHTLCLGCLKRLVKRHKIICPICKKEHQVPENRVEEFPENQHAVYLLAERQVSE